MSPAATRQRARQGRTGRKVGERMRTRGGGLGWRAVGGRCGLGEKALGVGLLEDSGGVGERA